MKTFRKLVAATLLMLPLLAFGVSGPLLAHAEESTSSSGSNSSSTETETNEDSKLTPQQRVDKRKTELKLTALAATEKLRIQAKCAGAQGIVKSVQNQSATAQTARTNVYRKLGTKLGELITKLKAANVDTTKLESERTVLQDKIKTFNDDLAEYKLAVSDLSTMDCKTDAEGFKASLQDARTKREKLKTDATDIRTYVKDTIKPTLQEIRKTLAAQKSTSDDSTNATEGQGGGQ